MSTDEQNNADEGQSSLTEVLGFVEFCEKVLGYEIKPYMKPILEAVERGERVPFDKVTCRRSGQEEYYRWIEYRKRMLRPNAKLCGGA